VLACIAATTLEYHHVAVTYSPMLLPRCASLINIIVAPAFVAHPYAAGPVVTIMPSPPPSRATTVAGTLSGDSRSTSSAAATYSWNNNQSNPDCCGGLIIEGCVQYPHGPTCWANATQPAGDYGWIVLGPTGITRTEDCPAIPADGIGSQLGKDTPLYPISLKEALTENGSPTCALACNISEVERTGIDPCNQGTIAANTPLPAWLLPPVQKTGSPEQLPGPVTMSCFWGGKGWMKDPTMGMCGYNATNRSPQGEFCPTLSAPPAGCPNLALDPRRFPCCGGSPRCAAAEVGPRPLCCECTLG
jgi:hypothetical protein